MYGRNFPEQLQTTTFQEISEIPEIMEITQKISWKIPGNFIRFSVGIQRYRAKIYIYILEKQRKIKENFGEVFGKFPKFRKFAKNFPGSFSEILRKIPGKLIVFFNVNTMLQIINLFF